MDTFSKFQPTREWIKLVEFSTQKLFQICACVIRARKAKHLDVTTILSCEHASQPVRACVKMYLHVHVLQSCTQSLKTTAQERERSISSAD